MTTAHRLRPERIRELLAYEAVTGRLTWLETRGKAAAGEEAGYLCRQTGYRKVGLDGREYLAHRLIWAMVRGVWPEAEVDHRDNNGANNAWLNLREATRGQNGMNKGAQARNTSGFKGVTWHKKARKWMAQINADGAHRYLGLHDTPEGAHAVYQEAAAKLHGEFARCS